VHGLRKPLEGVYFEVSETFDPKAYKFGSFLRGVEMEAEMEKVGVSFEAEHHLLFCLGDGCKLHYLLEGVMEFMGTGAATQKHFMFNIRRGKITSAIYALPFSLCFLIGLFRSKRGRGLGS
jgi:hypothetical protein